MGGLAEGGRGPTRSLTATRPPSRLPLPLTSLNVPCPLPALPPFGQSTSKSTGFAMQATAAGGQRCLLTNAHSVSYNTQVSRLVAGTMHAVLCLSKCVVMCVSAPLLSVFTPALLGLPT